MKRNIQLFAALLLAGLVGAGPTGDRLSEFCAGRRVQLKSVEDLSELVELADSNPTACLPRVNQALKAIEAITRDEQTCTMDKARAITKFVDDFLKVSSGASDEEGELPKALADFAVAYGMQVSKLCSREMVEKFIPFADARIHERLSSADYDKFLTFKKNLIDESSIGVLVSSITNAGEVILPADLMRAIPELEKVRLEMVLPDSEDATWIKSLCANTLQPMYEPVLLPLAHLMRAGFNSGSSRRFKSSGQDQKDNGRFWSAAVFFCEILKSVEVKESELDDQNASGDKLREAVAEANRKGLERGDDDEDKCARPVADTPVSLYQSDGRVEGKIVSSSVRSLVKSFDANKDEIERLRERIVKRSLRILKVLFKRGLLGPKLEKLGKMVRVKGGANTEGMDEVRAALVKLVDSNAGDSCQAAKLLRANSGQISNHERKGLAGILIMLVIFLVFVFFGVVSVKSLRRDPVGNFPE